MKDVNTCEEWTEKDDQINFLYSFILINECLT